MARLHTFTASLLPIFVALCVSAALLTPGTQPALAGDTALDAPGRTANLSVAPEALTPVTLLAPSDGDGVGTTTPQLVWQPVTGASLFLLHISRSDALALEDGVLWTWTSGTTFDVPPGLLDPDSTYYWSVLIPPSPEHALSVQQAGGYAWGQIWSFNTGTDPVNPELPAPDLFAPADQSITCDIVNGFSIPFSWQDNGADAYYIQIATNPSNFDNPDVVDETVLTASYIHDPELDPEVIYYWRVRSRHGLQWSAWADPWSFTPACLVSPSDGALEPGPTVTLSWAPELTAAATTLTLSVWDDQSTLVLNQGVEGQSQYEVPAAMLIEGPPYTWALNFWDGAGPNIITSERSFTVWPAPGEVTLVSPDDGQDGVAAKPRFEWEPVAFAETYTLEVSTDIDFTQEQIVNTWGGLTGTAFRSRVLLGYGESLFWRVRAENVNGDGPWPTTPYAFTTTSERPMGPLLKKPADGHVDVGENQKFKWHAYDGAESYRLQVALDPSFAPETIVKDFDDLLDDPPQVEIGQAAQGYQWFYWRVKASTQLDETHWSEPWHFRSKPSAPGPITEPGPFLGCAAYNTLPAALPFDIFWNETPPPDERARYGSDWEYQLQVRDRLDNDNVVFGPISMQQETARQMTTGDGLAMGGEYFFEVQVQVGDGATTIEGEWGGEVCYYDFDYYDHPNLTWPVDTTGVDPTNVDLQWDPVPPPGGEVEDLPDREQPWNYDVQLWYLDGQGNSVYVVDETTEQNPNPADWETESFYIFQGELSGSTEHFWRVRPRNPLGAHRWSPTESFSTAQGDPDVIPTLGEPEDGATVSLSPQLTWMHESAQHFEVWIQGEPTIRQARTATSWTVPVSAGLQAGQPYTWRVRGCSDAACTEGFTAWSLARSFTVEETVLTSPTLVAPIGDDIPHQGVTLEWITVSGADHYRVQYDTDEGFAPPEDEQIVQHPTHEWSIGDLAEATRYFWRVQACPPTGQGSCSAWATTSFTTQGVPPTPPAPLLDRPMNSATGVSLLPAFAWTAVAEAEVYQLLLADNADFDPQRWRVAVDTTGHSLPAHQALEAQTLYYWQVASGRLVGSDTTWGAFSSPVWSFTTGTSTEPPGPPTLDSPEDGAILGPVSSVMLAWTAPAGGAVSYTVEVAEDEAFTQGVRSYPGVAGESFEVMDLVEDRWYWWRVQSCDGGEACSDWSDPVRRFYTGVLAVQRYYYLKDHLGSVRATVDEGGGVVHHDDYYPFGAPMPGRSMETPEAPRERFTGHEVEMDIDPDYKAVYYAGKRYHDGLLGRWNAVDPLFEKHPDWSPYNYVLANPLRLIDPDGRQADVIINTVRASPIAKDANDLILGAVAAVYDNTVGIGNARHNNARLAHDPAIYNLGQDVGDLFSIGLGAAEMFAGGSIAVGGGGVTVGSGGTLSVVGVPAVSLGVAVGAHGFRTTVRGAGNLFNQNGRLYASGTGGGSAQQFQDTLQDILDNSQPGRRTKGKTRLRERAGGFDQANKDFDSLNPTDVKTVQTQSGEGRTGVLPDGRRITVRPGSTDGRPTLEIRPEGGGRGIEIRFNN